MDINILDFGASTELCDNSFAIQAAIDRAFECRGGRVTVPAGRFVTGTVYLKSNTELHLECGAVLKAHADPDAYNTIDAYPENYAVAVEGWDHRHLIIANRVKNAAITGFGKIEGCAESYFGDMELFSHFIWRDGFRTTAGIKDGKTRPGQLIVFIESEHIRVCDVTISNATAWSCFFHGCKYVQVRGIKVFNDKVHANTDGLDIDSCSFVTVSDCIIETGDDCIAIRGSAQRLSDRDRKCEYITVTNCILACSADAFRIGVGYGAVRHLRASNIVIHNAGNAIEFNTSYSGIGNCELDDINFSGMSVTGAVRLLALHTEAAEVSRVSLENIRAEVMADAYITADKPNIFRDVCLNNIDLYIKPLRAELTDALRKERGEHFLRCRNISNLCLQNVRFFADDELRSLWQGEELVE